MRTPSALLLLALALSGPLPSDLGAQPFNSGSDGSMGALVVAAHTNLVLPPDGIFHFTTITVNSARNVTFTRNALNTPVYLLATGDVIINGEVIVSGGRGTAVSGGLGGPGGFDGGPPNGAGLGPGGGLAGTGNFNLPESAGCGVYAVRAPLTDTDSTNQGLPYGSPLIVPLIGGSGGGGMTNGGGGGGGGAILIASNTRITTTGLGVVRAQGGFGHGTSPNGGSGGAIRLVAPEVSELSLQVVSGNSYGNVGRVRVDTLNRPAAASLNGHPASLGSFMTVFPPLNQKLDILEAAGTVIPEGTNAPVVVLLPTGTSSNQSVTVQARDFAAVVPIEVVLTPETGLPITLQTTIDNTTANPAIVTVPFTFPVNVAVHVHAWRR